MRLSIATLRPRTSVFGSRRAAHGTRLLACVVLGVVAPNCAAAQGAEPIAVQAGTVLDHDSVTVGEVVRLTVRVRAPRGATVNFPTAVDSLGTVQALEPPVVRNGSDTSATDRIAVYRLAAWDVGLQPVRLGDVLVQTDAGERRVVLSLPSLFVRSVLPADTALRVPKPARPLLVSPPAAPWWYWLIAAAAAFIVGLAIWLWRQRRGRELALVGYPYADAEAAFARVEALKLVEAGEPGRHAALMADVSRRYLAQSLEPASLALTSRELLEVLRGAPTVSYDALHSLLTEVDGVKFAAASIAGERARALGETARLIVREEHERAVARAAAAAAAANEARTRRAAA